MPCNPQANARVRGCRCGADGERHKAFTNGHRSNPVRERDGFAVRENLGGSDLPAVESKRKHSLGNPINMLDPWVLIGVECEGGVVDVGNRPIAVEAKLQVDGLQVRLIGPKLDIHPLPIPCHRDRLRERGSENGRPALHA
jgi:hypothetical protein